MGNDSTQQYTIRDLIGQSTIQHELIMKQIASSPVYFCISCFNIEFVRMLFHFFVT